MPMQTESPPWSLKHWFELGPARRRRIYTQVYSQAEIASPIYWANIVLSAGIATFGLVLNSPAVIIGAMLISPLMGPILAAGLALAVGDLYLLIKSLLNLFLSVAVAIVLSALLVWLLPFHSTTGEVVARINPNLLDLGVALLSGLAGSIAVTAAASDAVTTLPGVAVAVALMPPLCTVGFGLGFGPDKRIMAGAGLLFLTNLVAIIASAFFVFLLAGMNTAGVREELEGARSADLFAVRLAEGPLGRLVAKGATLHWRVIFLILLLATVAVPLRSALMQLAGEAIARTAAQDALRDLVPRGSLVSRQIEVGKDSVAVRLVLTRPVSSEAIDAAEQTIARRSGRRTEIIVSSVASQKEFAELLEKISSNRATIPAHAPPTLAEIQAELANRVDLALKEIWPQEAPLHQFNIEIGPSSLAVNTVYQATKDLDPITIGLIQRQLRQRLNSPDLTLVATRAPAQQKPQTTTRRHR